MKEIYWTPESKLKPCPEKIMKFRWIFNWIKRNEKEEPRK